jgi:FlaA1/EpsC-like NDP-sugar epimerase
MEHILKLIGRDQDLYETDIIERDADLKSAVNEARFLVIGGAGSIGQATVREIFRRGPSVLHVVDISENNMAELVRDLRSSLGYIPGDFRTFVLDCGSPEFESFQQQCGPYDYVLNFSALKHVRSEKDPWTLMRMMQVNIVNTVKTLRMADKMNARKYFCVSTDKAANPVNMMGASKRVMELFLTRPGRKVTVSTARFANVAFSDGSLLHGFYQRLMKCQPLAAPSDVRRYFMTPQESGELCLLSCLLGKDREVFFPKLDKEQNTLTFSELAVRFLAAQGYEAVVCGSEDEARRRGQELIPQKKWPCYFFVSDTTGEKDCEEFFVEGDAVDADRFHGIGVIQLAAAIAEQKLDGFLSALEQMRSTGKWTKSDLVDLVEGMAPEFVHKETHKYLDGRM